MTKKHAIFASILWKLSVQLFEKFCNQLFLLHCWHNFFLQLCFCKPLKFLFLTYFANELIILIFSFSEVGKQQFLDAGGLDKLKEFCTKSIFDDKRWDRLLYRACTGKTFSLILYFIYLHIIYIFYKIYFFQFFAKFVMLNRFL